MEKEEIRSKSDEDIIGMWERVLSIVVSPDITKARNGNKSAALRIRNACREISKKALIVRELFYDP